MTDKQLLRAAERTLVYGGGLVAGAYAAYAGTMWLRYGHVQPGLDTEHDRLLDRFIPSYEVTDRRAVHVRSPADVTFAAACDLDLEQSAPIRAIFKARSLILGGHSDARERPHGLLAWARSLGWGVLAGIHGREVVLGAVTRPWQADVVFRALPSHEFAAFDEPDFVKIVWTITVEPMGSRDSVVYTETRAVTTDPMARRKFRRYWALFSPGILLIRHLALKLVKAEAEHRARETRSAPVDRFDLVSAGDLDPQC